MNHGPLIFLGLFAALATSWFGMIVQPQLQLGRATSATNLVNTSSLYPQARSGLAQRGLEVYRSLGCATCHSQQVRQEGVRLNVLLTAEGTNRTALVEAMRTLRPALNSEGHDAILGQLPAVLLPDLKDPDAANSAVKLLNDAGAKARVQLLAYGPDIERGWGDGRSVAADFLYDRPALPGRIRLGPDLANVGQRLPNSEWHLLHLYDPTGVTPTSVMPPYRFLFDRRRMGDGPAAKALRLSPAVAETVGENYEVLPTDEARALAAYLVSLKSDVPLLERPLTTSGEPTASTSTNSISTDTNSTPDDIDSNPLGE